MLGYIFLVRNQKYSQQNKHIQIQKIPNLCRNLWATHMTMTSQAKSLATL